MGQSVSDTLEIIQKDLAKPKVNKKKSDREAAPAVNQEPKQPKASNQTEKISQGIEIDKKAIAPNSMGHGHFKIGGAPPASQPSDDLDDLFLPQNEQPSVESMTILKPYNFPTVPEFYQPPAWRWIREVRKDQNSKSKYYKEIPECERGIQKYNYTE